MLFTWCHFTPSETPRYGPGRNSINNFSLVFIQQFWEQLIGKFTVLTNANSKFTTMPLKVLSVIKNRCQCL